MSVSINRVILAGNVTRDPELKSLGNDRQVASFALAINRRWRDSGGQQHEDVTFVDLEAWGRTASLAQQYLHKGDPCCIEGRLRLDQWKDSNGKNQSRLKVVVEQLQFLSSQRPGHARYDNGYQQPADRHVSQRRVGESGPTLEESVLTGSQSMTSAVP
ncbi:MAG: single-stranded DNA-binding protein [Planctomycetota bacterium]|nr:MAG: single-stranded DNA-binding protein [Planctomycetota bacterium]